MVVLVVVLRLRKGSALVHHVIPVEILVEVETVPVFTTIPVACHNNWNYRLEFRVEPNPCHQDSYGSGQNRCSWYPVSASASGCPSHGKSDSTLSLDS